MYLKTCLKIEMAGADIITNQRKAVTFHGHGKYDKHILGIVKVGGGVGELTSSEGCSLLLFLGD